MHDPDEIAKKIEELRSQIEELLRQIQALRKQVQELLFLPVNVGGENISFADYDNWSEEDGI